jgi:cytochrome c nitrite reductase small subunit
MVASPANSRKPDGWITQESDLQQVRLSRPRPCANGGPFRSDFRETPGLTRGAIFIRVTTFLETSDKAAEMQSDPKSSPRGVLTFVRGLVPPAQWRVPVFFTLAVFCGLAGLVFHVSRATSYLSDHPQTCVNCHVMAPQYVTWAGSRHRTVATCNDCHVPQDSFLRHYAFKASDGLRHAFIFTFRLEPQVIRIHSAGQRVVQENCIRCHSRTVHNTRLELVRGDDRQHQEGLRCWDCHRETPHGRVNSLAAVPYEHVPLPGPATPRWLRDLMGTTAAVEQP